MGIQIVANVDPGQVEMRTRLYLDAGATSVTPVREPDGQFTLVVVWDDTTHAMQPIAAATEGGGATA